MEAVAEKNLLEPISDDEVSHTQRCKQGYVTDSSFVSHLSKVLPYKVIGKRRIVIQLHGE